MDFLAQRAHDLQRKISLDIARNILSQKKTEKFQRFKERKCKPRIVYPAKVTFKDQETFLCKNSIKVVLDSLRNLLKNKLQKTKMTTEIYTLV